MNEILILIFPSMCLVSLESTKPTEFKYVYNRTNKTHKKKKSVGKYWFPSILRAK